MTGCFPGKMSLPGKCGGNLPFEASVGQLLRRAAGGTARLSVRHALAVSLPLVLFYTAVFSGAGWLLWHYGSCYVHARAGLKTLAGAGIVAGYLLAGAALGTVDAAVSAANALIGVVEAAVRVALKAALKAVEDQLAKLSGLCAPAAVTGAVRSGVARAELEVAGPAPGAMYKTLVRALFGIIRPVLSKRALAAVKSGGCRAAVIAGDRVVLFLSVMAGIRLRLMAVRLAVRFAALVLLAATILLIRFAL